MLLNTNLLLPFLMVGIHPVCAQRPKTLGFLFGGGSPQALQLEPGVIDLERALYPSKDNEKKSKEPLENDFEKPSKPLEDKDKGKEKPSQKFEDKENKSFDDKSFLNNDDNEKKVIECLDNTKFKYRNQKNKNCKWVSRKATANNVCDRIWKGKSISKYCPMACNNTCSKKDDIVKPGFDKDDKFDDKELVDINGIKEKKPIDNKPDFEKPNNNYEKPNNDKDEKPNDFNFNSKPTDDFQKPNFYKDNKFDEKEPVDPNYIEEKKNISNKPDFKKPNNKYEKPNIDKDEKPNDFDFNNKPVDEFQKPNFDKDVEFENKDPVDPIIFEEEKSVNNKPEFKKPNNKYEKPNKDKKQIGNKPDFEKPIINGEKPIIYNEKPNVVVDNDKDSCVDLSQFRYKNKKNKGCAWVGRKPNKRCNIVWKNKKVSGAYCPVACGLCK